MFLFIQVFFYNLLKKCFGKVVLPFKSNRILIIRLDAIGDYILFRNYLSVIKESDRFNRFHITYLGNKIVRDLAEEYDAKFIDNFIWIDPTIVNNLNLINQVKRIKLAFKLKLNCYDIIINPVHSRIKEVDDFITLVGAKKNIGSTGDTSNIGGADFYLKNIDYDHLINIPDFSNFEFFRNHIFFQQLCGINQNIPSLFLPVEPSPKESVLKVIIVPGAGAAFRRWSTTNFATAINLIAKNLSNFNLNFILTGISSEENIAQEIIQQLEPIVQYKDMTGKLSLVELVSSINNANLVISNETSAVHIAAAVKTGCICISNGNHFGRFNPIPSTLAKNIFTFYPDGKFYDENFKKELIDKCRIQSPFSINKIQAFKVAEKATGMLLTN